MTKDKAKELAELFNAYAKGETIETLDGCGHWVEASDKDIELRIFTRMLRIKPKNLTEERCWKCGKLITPENVSSVCYPSFPPKHTCKECEEVDLPEFCGESVESKYRPFEETAELMLYFYKHFNKECKTFEEPLIWVKRKDSSYDSRVLITGYDEISVFLEDVWIDLKELYEQYVFLDNSLIGKEE